MSEKAFTIALVGNPNVGKSTVFNKITGLNQHTGNWSGKTVDVCQGELKSENRIHKIIDLPGSYSISADSEEEIITKEYIESNDYDAIIIVADANALERNLSFILQILMKTHKAVLCLNMVDLAEKNGIEIEEDELSLMLGIPVVKVVARNKKGIKQLVEKTLKVADGQVKTFPINDIVNLNNINDDITLSENLATFSHQIVKITSKTTKENNKDINRKLDKLFTSRFTGIPIMLMFLLGLFWLTAYGANFPSEILNNIFGQIINFAAVFLQKINTPQIITSFLCDGVLKTACWVVAVMLPPALIFFPLFSILEDFGYLPRVAFNMDGLFMKSGTSGKQSLAMMMGFGCNACGVVGCRIISNKCERNIAMMTNSFIPCNGRIPTLIVMSSLLYAIIFDSQVSLVTALTLLLIIMLSVGLTFIVTKILALIYKTDSSHFILELPSYKQPEFFKTIALSIKNKVFSVLIRAVVVALPAGAIIWLLANVSVSDKSLLNYVTDFMDPVGKIIGVDGTVVTAFILGFPANEIVIPIMLMSYTSGSSLTDFSSVSALGRILSDNGWDAVTVICTLILCVFHFPCSTTCITIYKETKSKMITALSVLIPLIIGIILCFFVNLISHIFF